MKPIASPPPTPSIQVLERTFKLLGILESDDKPLSLKDIALRADLHPSTAHRILNDLVCARLVERPESGHYRLGMRLLELGNAVKSRLNVREAALEPMRQLHQHIEQSVNLSVRQGDEIVYIERTYSERSGMQVVRTIGGRAPLHLTSVGKLFLAHDDDLRVQSYAIRTGLPRTTPNSVGDLASLEKELDEVRQSGIARDNEELELGVRCVAVGIYGDHHQLVAGLSISPPAQRLLDEWLPNLIQAAADISAALGADKLAKKFPQK